MSTVKSIFDINKTPVAIYPVGKGVKGLVTVKMDANGGSSPSSRFHVAILRVEGVKEPNAQLTANLNNEAYYALFGHKMTTTTVTCLDLPGVCDGKGRKVARLEDAVDAMDKAIRKGRLPTVRVTYAPYGTQNTVTITGYLTSIPFTLESKFRCIMSLVITGYVK